MANDDHIAQLKKGVAAWNAWRAENPDISPDLQEANLGEWKVVLEDGAPVLHNGVPVAKYHGPLLAGFDLSHANLSYAELVDADLSGANLSRASLFFTQFRNADLRRANLSQAGLSGARFNNSNLTRANLSGAFLYSTQFFRTNLSKANLSGAHLEAASLLKVNLAGADLTGCRIYGISAWGLKTERAKQQNLIITDDGEAAITVDNIEVAQFIYLMLHNEKIRDVIDTITSKAVLILGRFTDERKAVLDALREELRKRDYLPIMFDFEKPGNRDTVETITLLARMARFIIADLSDAKAVVQELQAIVPQLPSVPVQPIILGAQEEPGMFDHIRNFRSFMSVYRYTRQEQLLADLGDKVIHRAELKVRKLRG